MSVWSGTRVLIAGLGRSGVAAARFLLAQGAVVSAWDDKSPEALSPEAQSLAEGDIHLISGEDFSHGIFETLRAVVVSPGVPLDRPLLVQARRHGVPLLSEIDLVPAEEGARAVAVTGSNGKSTTTALVAAMLGQAGRKGVACGNYGTPFVEAYSEHPSGTWFAVELSSFQLESTTRMRFAGAVLLNVQPDHLDRHGSFESYREAKFRIAGLRRDAAVLVVGADDESASTLLSAAASPVYGVSATRRLSRGGWLDEGRLIVDLGEGAQILGDADRMPLPGRHNLLNILSAAVSCLAVSVSLEAIKGALESFSGLPHRLEEVARIGGVRFIDDSKATNVASSIEAVRAFPTGRLFVLLGGRDKDGDFEPLAQALRARHAEALVFGEAGEKIASSLERSGGIEPHRCGTMEDAIDRARALAAEGDVVLLSPACASFDAFDGFAHRGERFAAAVRAGQEAR